MTTHRASDPFWEAGYADAHGPSVFGEPSPEIVDLVPELPGDARVLDLGCGDGRNALHLLGRGLRVMAVDVSEQGIAKLVARSGEHGDRLKTAVQDVRDYGLQESFELVIAHGVLHLMPRPDWRVLLTGIQEHTVPLGYNVVAVFTDTLAPPDDLRPFVKGLFREGELLDLYRGWRVREYRSYILDDEHPGGIRHRHPINRIVAQKPGP